MGRYKGVSCLSWRWPVAMALVATLLAIPVSAQLPTGTILGTVKDTSGGVVAGATVTVQNTETGSARTVNTGDDGAYRFAGLAVGHYDVKAEKEGFKPVTQRGLVLDVSAEVVLNFALEVGTASQQVVVTGEAPQVNTTSGSLGGLVNEERIAELPLNGRNYLDLTLLQPGVSQSTTVINLGGGTQGAIFSSNGAPVTSNNFLLDGTPTGNVLGLNGASASGTTLGVDGIREYKVVTNAFSAEYGMTMGSQMTIVSKGGGNRFHGDVFEYLRNRVLDARNFFDDSYQQTGKRNPKYIRNNFGAAFGGPIKKDKTFFWAVYEGLRQIKGYPVITNTIPAACLGPANAVIWNGQGTQPSGSSGPCPDLGLNPSGSGTNSVTVNSTIAPLAALFSAANSNYTFTSPDSVNHGQIRVDQNFSNNDSFFARFTIEDDAQIRPSPGNDPSNAVPFGYKQFQDTWTSRSHYTTLSESHIFSPTLLNTVRLSFSRTNVPTDIIAPDSAVTADNVSFAGGGKPIGLVVFGANNGNPGAITTMGPDLAGPNYHLQNFYSLADDLFYTKGKHALKFGVLINRINLVIGETVFDRGQLNFGSCDPTQAGNKSNAVVRVPLACFLQNLPALELGAVQGGIERRHFNYYTYGFYGQDDWRATSRLTLNLGLRYEFNTTVREAHGLESALRSLSDTTLTQGPIMRNASLKNFSPRVGFAYDPTGKGKTSIRGAFGVYYDVATIGQTTFTETVGDPPFRTIQGNAQGTPTLASGFQPGFMTQSPFVPPFFNPGATSTFPGYSLFNNLNGFDDYNINQPYLMQWNLTADHQLPGGIGLSASYVGTRGVHIWGQGEGNPCRPTSVVNGVPNWANLGDMPCPAYPDSADPSSLGIHTCPLFVAPSFSIRIPTGRSNCSFGFIDLIDTNSRSWYDGLQVSVQKRLTHGLEFQSAYTWSQSLDTAQGQLFITGEIRNNNTTLNINKGRTKFAAAHNWRFNALYHFPGVKSDNFGRKLLNGWWMGNIISLQSGYAFTPLLTNNQSLSGVAGGISDRTDLAATYDPSKVILGKPDQWFDTSMFATQAPGFLGNAGRGILTGPGLFN